MTYDIKLKLGPQKLRHFRYTAGNLAFFPPIFNIDFSQINPSMHTENRREQEEQTSWTPAGLDGFLLSMQSHPKRESTILRGIFSALLNKGYRMNYLLILFKNQNKVAPLNPKRYISLSGSQNLKCGLFLTINLSSPSQKLLKTALSMCLLY